MSYLDDYLDESTGVPAMTGGVSMGGKPAPALTDYRTGYLQQLDAMSQKALTANYGGNSQQAWQMPAPAPESARSYRARTGRISARQEPEFGRGAAGGLVSGGMAKTPENWAKTFPTAPDKMNSGRMAGGLAFKPKPEPSWKPSAGDYAYAQQDVSRQIGGGTNTAWSNQLQAAGAGPSSLKPEYNAPAWTIDTPLSQRGQPGMMGVKRMTPAVDADPRKFADKLFA